VPEEQVVLWGRPAGIASKYLSGKKQFHLDRRGIEDRTLGKKSEDSAPRGTSGA